MFCGAGLHIGQTEGERLMRVLLGNLDDQILETLVENMIVLEESAR